MNQISRPRLEGLGIEVRRFAELAEDVAEEGREHHCASEKRLRAWDFGEEQPDPEGRERNFKGGDEGCLGGGNAPRTESIKRQSRRVLHKSEEDNEAEIARRDRGWLGEPEADE